MQVLLFLISKLNTKETTLFGKDGKWQVSVKYDNDKPVSISVVVVSLQTKPGNKRKIYELLIPKAIKEINSLWTLIGLVVSIPPTVFGLFLYSPTLNQSSLASLIPVYNMLSRSFINTSDNGSKTDLII